MAKRKANVPEELRILKTRIAELECMQQTNNSEAFEQSGNAEVNDDGGQTEENQGPIEVDQRHQQKQFREKISGMEVEMSNTQQLCMITQFENKLLQSKLKHYELMKEQNELQAKVVEMEDQQKKKKKQGRKEDEQGKNVSEEQIKAIFDRIDDLEKQQQMKYRFSIGLASKAMPLDDCVGHHWDSYGYESGGNFRTSGSVWLNEDRYEYSRGDIIGCGVNLASRRIIFTHNGRRLDTSDLFLSPSSVGWLTVFAKLSILVPNYADFFYFEIKVKNMKEAVLFGFATKQKHGELRGHVRNGPGIFSYESDGTFWASGSVEPNAKFATGSVVGCGINLNNRQLIFTKNGQRIDDDDYRVPSSVGPLFPFVTLFAVGEKIEANFGPKFHFNFENI
ncbi:hypothetical protein niasHT_022245 [Heterodera trifolii]|uniref:B30.2/SPRY domain-containing protein n=1 Tax=Heterodera trifolii TaxID=157864 RepID=A0ABD2KL58_9BILA